MLSYWLLPVATPDATLTQGSNRPDLNISWQLLWPLMATTRSKKRELSHGAATPNILAAVPHRICCFSASLSAASCTTLTGTGSPIGKG